MTPLEQITAIIDSAAFPERPDIPDPARVSAHKDQTSGRRKAPAPSQPSESESKADALQTESVSSAASDISPAVPESGETSENFAGGDPVQQALREQDQSPNSAEPCVDGIDAENVVEFSPRPRKRRARKKSGGDDGKEDDAKETDTELFKPRKFGFDVEQLNQEYSLVLLGSKAVVFREQSDAPLEDKQRILSTDGFSMWLANRFTERRDPKTGEIKAVSWAAAWLQSPKRRSYGGVEFHPDPNNAPGTKGYLNLWSGFAIEPVRKGAPGTYKTFRDHLVNNVCRGDKALFDWVFAFFAQIVQRPRERIGVALVMRGSMGSGKTKVGEVFGSLFPRHYFMVDDPRYVTGQFNAHMATCLLLQADEAVWAGDKKAEGRLKGLVTAPIQQIERKGIDAIRLPNYVRLIMTSNEDWVVPAGKDERRSCVLDVDARCAQNHDYFRQIDAELDAGGREQLLADLLAFDLESVNLRQIPRTDALLEQKVRSLDSVDGWWFERLMAGTATRRASVWVDIIACQTLFDDYILHSERIGIKRKQDETVLGIKLAKLLPGGIRKVRREVDVTERNEGDGSYRTVTKRTWCYLLPPLDQTREHFEELVGQKVAWPVAIEEPERARGGDDVAL